MRRLCECGHDWAHHCGFFDDCMATVRGGFCGCRCYVDAPSFWYLRRVWRWLKAVPR